jgi:hypothetical protein
MLFAADTAAHITNARHLYEILNLIYSQGFYVIVFAPSL